MNKYINVEVAKEYLRHDSFSNPYFRSQACQQAMDVLDTVPTADVIEVKHGYWGNRWICSNMTGYEYACSCSECNKSTYRISTLEPMPPYCPNCGAKMDGKTNE